MSEEKKEGNSLASVFGEPRSAEKQKEVERLASLLGWVKVACPGLPLLGWAPFGGNYYDRRADLSWDPFESWSDAGMLLERLRETGDWYRFIYAYCDTVKVKGDTGDPEPARLLGMLGPATIARASLDMLDTIEKGRREGAG